MTILEIAININTLRFYNVKDGSIETLVSLLDHVKPKGVLLLKTYHVYLSSTSFIFVNNILVLLY